MISDTDNEAFQTICIRREDFLFGSVGYDRQCRRCSEVDQLVNRDPESQRSGAQSVVTLYQPPVYAL